MKRVFTILATVILTVSIFAQAPKKMSYQAVVRNSSNALVTSSTVGMRISILQGSKTGTLVYTETQTPSTNANGLITIEIGGGTGFDTISWANGPYFIETETDPTGGTTYTITGASQLLSVPYALHAKTAESISGTITETDPVYSESEAANVTASDITNLGNLSGINTGDQDGSETKVTAGANVTVTGEGTNGNPYVINASGDSSRHQVGELYEGGIIFNIDPSGQHGLICSLIDISTNMYFSNVQSTSIGTGAQSLWNGLMNSDSIVAQAGHTESAAKLCLDYTNSDYGTGIFSDWYLPSIDELHIICNTRYVLNKTIETDGNSSTIPLNMNPYISSTELSSTQCLTVNFLYGSMNNNNKNYIGSVRAVRTF